MTDTEFSLGEIERLVAGHHHDPHSILGAHPGPEGVVVRALRPVGASVTVVLDDGRRFPMTRLGRGVFTVTLPDEKVPDYRLATVYPGGRADEAVADDPYRYLPMIGEFDLYLIAEGRHEELWRVLGAHVREAGPVTGTSFAVWAPNALGVRVTGDFNYWDGRAFPMRSLGGSGVWELFVPGVADGARYKYAVCGRDGVWRGKADPLAAAAERPPGTASVVFTSRYAWADAEWMAARSGRQPVREPMSIYEVHLGSWRPGLSYRQLAVELVGYVTDLGFTHVEFLPVAEHPFGGSWGYQVTSYYAPTARFGNPDDFRHLVDALHQAGIGVLLDWVPAHFPRDDWALARFDGTALYEHPDPRRGAQPDWGTLVFNFGRNEVRNFLVANAVYWLEEFHVDGLRVDAVASMLYLDYSRKDGEWTPNQYGGRENLDAVLVPAGGQRHLLQARSRHHDDRRGVDRLARGVPAGVPGRAGLRLQVEHGLDARHARLPEPGSGLPDVPPQRDDVLDDVRLLGELHPGAVARRGGARQELAGEQDARRRMAQVRRAARAAGVHVGAPGQAAAVHGGRVRPA